MARLSACYFCGIALDEPITDYSVTPDAASASEDLTISLCESCQEKLDRVLDAAFSALEGTDETTFEGEITDAADDSPDSAPASDPDDGLVDPEAPTGTAAGDGGSVAAESTDQSPAEDSPAESGDPEPEADHEPDPLAAASGVADDGDDEPEPEASEPPKSAQTSEETPDETDAEPGAESQPDAPDGEDAAAEDDADADEADADADDADADDADSTERSVVDGQHSISALEYNKVMRLLQNREFPVDRDEIVTVAANAYGLGRSECEKVIDVAVDRGLIEEANGQLDKPENS